MQGDIICAVAGVFMENRTLNIKVCGECPFCIWVNTVGSDLCFHPQTKHKSIKDINVIPYFCPLKEYKITIQLNGMDK